MKLIKNALIYYENKTHINDIKFDDKILEITENIPQTSVDEVIDLQGKLLIPGCIDAHVHFNDPGFTDRENFTTGTTAAAFGGITTIIDMPCTSIPAVTNKENLLTKLSVIKSKALIDFAFWGGIRGNDFPPSSEIITELWNTGVVGFKIYTISGMDTFTALSYDEIALVFQQFPEILFAFHAEDENIIKKSISGFTKDQLRRFENYVKTRPVEAEVQAIENILSSLQENNNIHFVHVSSKQAAELILQNKKKYNITFESCPQYLQFTSDDFAELRGKLKTAPPVKYNEDKKFLRDCLKNSTLDFVTTDHAGCEYESGKKFKDFSKVYNGIPGTQLMIPYLFSEFYLNEHVSLKKMIDLTSKNAAKRYGLFPNKGSLEIGTDADFTVIDLNKPFIVDESKLESIGKYSPFNGSKFSCTIDKTIVRGDVVFDSVAGLLQKPGFGKFIRRI